MADNSYITLADEKVVSQRVKTEIDRLDETDSATATVLEGIATQLTSCLTESDVITDSELDLALNNVSVENTSGPRIYPIKKNKLRNWYFKKPVNQKGKNQYAGIGSEGILCIDSWIFVGGTGTTINLEDDGLHTTAISNSNALMRQYLDDEIHAGTYTISALMFDGELFFQTVEWNGENAISTDTYFSDYDACWFVINKTHERNAFNLVTGPAMQSRVTAVKLEEGSEQTLCYKDASGAWRLYETPDYDLEYIKSLTYQCNLLNPSDTAYTASFGPFLAISDTFLFGQIQTPMMLKFCPALETSCSETNKWMAAGVFSDGYVTQAVISGITIDGRYNSGVTVSIKGSNFVAGNFYLLLLHDQTSETFFLEANS